MIDPHAGNHISSPNIFMVLMRYPYFKRVLPGKCTVPRVLSLFLLIPKYAQRLAADRLFYEHRKFKWWAFELLANLFGMTNYFTIAESRCANKRFEKQNLRHSRPTTILQAHSLEMNKKPRNAAVQTKHASNLGTTVALIGSIVGAGLEMFSSEAIALPRLGSFSWTPASRKLS